ncbi:gap junction delta-4 protein-like [Myripristis murdjan]|uniref:gap junction delta-4 protein-like n=1 Tax=Myripristis murdjan TaxID=586833 RepID=UPI00117610B3|nr:gap junction delta-4 protein-like [Myripristis murdjan]
MLVLRPLVLLLAGFTLFSDEQERFVCNTIQPGCSNVCFDVFAPVSVLRLWLFHFILLCLPHLMFATYIMHKVLSARNFGAYFCDRSRGSSPFMREISNSSRETSISKAPLQAPQSGWATPRFHCTYILIVILRILLETAFGAGQFFLFGFSLPKSFLCYEAPCTSGVECYISRPTEKTLMLNFMLGLASLSVLLSLFDLVSSMNAMMRWRRKRAMLVEEMSKGEQSSVFTSTSGAEDIDALLTKRAATSGSLKSDVKDEKNISSNVTNSALVHAKLNCESTVKADISGDERIPESKDAKMEVPRSPTPMGSPMPPQFVLHSHLNKPPLSPRPDRGPPLSPRVPTPIGGKKLSQCTSVATSSGQQSENSEAQDKRAWV